MINPALLQRALKSKKQNKEADGFSAPAFFSEIDKSFNYVETYFTKSPVDLWDSAEQMHKESSVGNMEMNTSVWDMLQGDKE